VQWVCTTHKSLELVSARIRERGDILVTCTRHHWSSALAEVVYFPREATIIDDHNILGVLLRHARRCKQCMDCLPPHLLSEIVSAKLWGQWLQHASGLKCIFRSGRSRPVRTHTSERRPRPLVTRGKRVGEVISQELACWSVQPGAPLSLDGPSPPRCTTSDEINKISSSYTRTLASA